MLAELGKVRGTSSDGTSQAGASHGNCGRRETVCCILRKKNDKRVNGNEQVLGSESSRCKSSRMETIPFSICKVLENRSKQDEERMDQLMTQLKEARLIAEDADTKSDEIDLEEIGFRRG